MVFFCFKQYRGGKKLEAWFRKAMSSGEDEKNSGQGAILPPPQNDPIEDHAIREILTKEELEMPRLLSDDLSLFLSKWLTKVKIFAIFEP